MPRSSTLKTGNAPMDRRQFLTTAALATGGLALGLDAQAAQASLEQTVAQRFAAARATNPRLAGFANAPGEFDLPSIRMEGRWPSDLVGSFFRNGPGQFERAGVRYQHWFDGDGLIQRWQFGGGRVGYKGKFVASKKRVAEEAAGRFLYPAGGGGIRGEAPLTGPDSVNVANINTIKIGDKMWALWEGGSPTEIDPRTLETKGIVTLSDDLRGAPFSAHPRLGADGRIWNFGSFGDKLALYRLSALGQLEAVKLHKIPPIGLIHDFVLTEKSVVIVLPSTRMDDEGDGLFAQVKGRPDKPILVKVFDRETLALTREAELPAGYVFHFGNGWEEADGTIRFDMAYGVDCNELQLLRQPMFGQIHKNRVIGRQVTLPPTGAPRVNDLRVGIEFPRINQALTTKRNRYIFTAAQAVPGRSIWFDAVAKLDQDTGRHSFAQYGPDWMVEEHVFVPRPGSTREDDGWLIGTALNWRQQKTALSVFDARHLERGPLARAWLEVAMPLGFHGQFVAGNYA
jgi:all-trans-8'-apo-beta-carotenal 15,15'-oxygenase